MQKPHKKIMVFGVFDGLHDGHRHFLVRAREHGDELIAVVARDRSVKALKNKTPFYGERQRLNAVRSVPEVAQAILGDDEQGSYGVIAAYQPDIICLGYDQHGLGKDLHMRMESKQVYTIPIVRITPHQPERWHSALLTPAAGTRDHEVI